MPVIVNVLTHISITILLPLVSPAFLDAKDALDQVKHNACHA
jgi:hypothetical protein